MVTTWAILPGMRERKTGIIINIASRAATVDFPFGLGYNSSKAAVARATSTLQEEIDLDGLGETVQTFALHPGGVYTAMGSGECSQFRPDHYSKNQPLDLNIVVSFRFRCLWTVNRHIDLT